MFIFNHLNIYGLELHQSTKVNRKNRYGYIEGILSILVNTILFTIKYWAGIVSGSVALIADAWHTLSDSISSLIVIAGVKLSSRKPDRKHPFGHGRYEQVAAIFIGFLLGIVAYEFLMESIEKLQQKETANFGTVAIVVTIASILIKEGLAQYAFFAYKKTGFSTMKADGWHHRSDALSSVIVLIGIFLKNYFWWVDGVMGLIISGMLLWAVFSIVKDAISKILGERPSEEIVEKVKKILHNYTDFDFHPHHFHLHDYGDHKELTFHIQLNGQMYISKAHAIATNIEQEIKQKMNITATIHIEPLGKKH